MRERKARGRSRNAANEGAAVEETGHVETSAIWHSEARDIVYRSRALRSGGLKTGAASRRRAFPHQLDGHQ